ncbi:MAG TPA: MazG nucleotide pyrophosphohydrolase domain-containing protein [Candidatus Bathyarchaeia archaeon]|nr:MazG nucleotide pyrophosphohydrolase domain-containing protein [Candidatus Bathyarchaeia archaeon]
MAVPDEAGHDPIEQAWRVHRLASSLGFDWPDISGVFEKVREELGEIEHAWHGGDRVHARRELGDLLFAAVNLARFLDADASGELIEATARFARRFELLKQEIVREGRRMQDCSLAELDVVWARVKKMAGEREKGGMP